MTLVVAVAETAPSNEVISGIQTLYPIPGGGLSCPQGSTNDFAASLEIPADPRSGGGGHRPVVKRRQLDIGLLR